MNNRTAAFKFMSLFSSCCGLRRRLAKVDEFFNINVSAVIDDLDIHTCVKLNALPKINLNASFHLKKKFDGVFIIKRQLFKMKI